MKTFTSETIGEFIFHLISIYLRTGGTRNFLKGGPDFFFLIQISITKKGGSDPLPEDGFFRVQELIQN